MSATEFMSPSFGNPPLVTVFGGSGFLGRFVVAALAERGYRIRVAVRRPDLAWYLKTLGEVGQIQPVQANLRNKESIAHAVKGASSVINLAAILQETKNQKFEAIHAEGPKLIAEALDDTASLIHVSALGADLNARSLYAQTKARGEENILKIRPDAVILRPSVIFGEGDAFFNRLAWLIRLGPVLPVPGLRALMQPVYGGDVAKAILNSVQGQAKEGTIYELGGPHIQSFKDILEYIAGITGRKCKFMNMPAGLARFHAFMMELTDKLTLGLVPDELVVTRDQLALLDQPNIVSHQAMAENRTFAGLGIVPQSFEGIVPEYLERFCKTGQFEKEKVRAEQIQSHMTA